MLESPDNVPEEQWQEAASPEVANKRCALDVAREGAVAVAVVRICAISIWLVTGSNGSGNVCRIVVMALVRRGWLMEEIKDIKEQLAGEL